MNAWAYIAAFLLGAVLAICSHSHTTAADRCGSRQQPRSAPSAEVIAPTSAAPRDKGSRMGGRGIQLVVMALPGSGSAALSGADA